MYNLNGKPVSYQKLSNTGRPADFALATPKLKQGATFFYIKSLKSTKVNASASRAVVVRYESAVNTMKLFKACKDQSVWMKNFTYQWQNNPTVAKSKYRGTCVTYVACVLQRCGYIKSGECIWHDGRGHVDIPNKKMRVIYPKTTLKGYKKSLKPGDILVIGNPRSVEARGTSHICIFTGKWSGNSLKVWDQTTAKRGFKPVNCSGGSNIIGIVRLK